jgi:signal transduction histidine kinase
VSVEDADVSSAVPEVSLPPSVQQDLLRIAQEAMSNAVRHAKPTVISVHLRKSVLAPWRAALTQAVF